MNTITNTNLKPLVAYYNTKVSLLENLEHLADVLSVYLRDNKQELGKYLEQDDLNNYELYLEFVKQYYNSNDISYYDLDKVDLTNFKISNLKAQEIIRFMFPFSLFDQLKDFHCYPIEIKGDLIPQINDGIKQSIKEKLKIKVTPEQFSKMKKLLSLFYVSLFESDSKGEYFLMEMCIME